MYGSLSHQEKMAGMYGKQLGKKIDPNASQTDLLKHMRSSQKRFRKTGLKRGAGTL